MNTQRDSQGRFRPREELNKYSYPKGKQIVYGNSEMEYLIWNKDLVKQLHYYDERLDALDSAYNRFTDRQIRFNKFMYLTALLLLSGIILVIILR